MSEWKRAEPLHVVASQLHGQSGPPLAMVPGGCWEVASHPGQTACWHGQLGSPAQRMRHFRVGQAGWT
jgi:hypothetical protein